MPEPRVLVAFIGQSRASELTAEAFFENVLGQLGADLALAVREGEEPNPFHERAKHVWTYPETGDWARDYDREVGSDAWRVLLEVPGGHFLGGIQDDEFPQETSAGILYFYRRFLRQSLEAAGLVDEYDWIVVSRSDFLWPAPHPEIRHLSDRRIYFLDGEGYGGVEDRHCLFPSRYAKDVLSLTDPVFDDPVGLRPRIDRVMAQQDWSLLNIERYLAWQLRERGLWRRVGYLPYLPYAVRPPGGHTTWSTGTFDEERGYYVKYQAELELSEIARRFIRDQESWARYLSPLRGARQRRELEREYRRREPKEYGRPFTGRAEIERRRRRLEAGLPEVPARIGRQLRKLPGISALLDARLRRMRQRSERRQG
jgi:hypothetical protein